MRWFGLHRLILGKSHHRLTVCQTERRNQVLVGAIPFYGEYPSPRFEDKFRSANQMDGI